MQKQGGMTMIELVIAMAIAAMAVGVLVSMYLAGGKALNTEKNMSDIMVESSRAMNTMSSELRNCLTLEAVSATSISYWHKDLNNNGSREASEDISYSWDGTTGGNIMRTADGSTTAISRFVQNLALSYDSPDKDLIKKVTIRLTNALGNDITTAETTVLMRNL